MLRVDFSTCVGAQMSMTKQFFLAALTAGLVLGQAAGAQVLREPGPPSEQPPAGYAGTQYVDSRGCVYVRAGISGNVTWVPRVNRGREQLCGFTPTGEDGPVAAAPPPRTAPPPNPLEIGAAALGEQVAEITPEDEAPPAPQPEPVRTAAAAPAPAPVQPAPRVVSLPRQAAPAPAP
ncbi:hypothetical protein OG2516_13494, partial [Oceanicola granulosus HTCC2516]